MNLIIKTEKKRHNQYKNNSRPKLVQNGSLITISFLHIAILFLNFSTHKQIPNQVRLHILNS